MRVLLAEPTDADVAPDALLLPIHRDSSVVEVVQSPLVKLPLKYRWNDAEVVALVGKTFLLRIDPMGGVTRKAQADDAEPDEAVQVLCNMISGIFKYVPEKPVAIGGKWTRSEDAEGKIRIRGTNTFTFAECSGGTLLISLRGTISGKSERSAKAQHEVKGTSEGTMKLDEETRFPLESTMKQNMTIHNAVDDIHWTARAQNLVELSVTIESVSSATPGR